jgi:hypothetical protein
MRAASQTLCSGDCNASSVILFGAGAAECGIREGRRQPSVYDC